MKLRARRAGLAATAILGVAALAGCSSATGSAADASGTLVELSDDQQVEIVFESYNLANVGTWSDAINQLLDEFMVEHPNISVVGQPSSSAGTAASVQQQLLAGAAPDIAQLTFNELDFAATTLGAQNLTALVGQEGLDAQFGGEYPYHERAAVLADWDDAAYGLPYVFSTPVLWTNAEAFATAGLDAETVDLSTWEAVSEAAATITAATDAPSLSISCVITGGSWCMQGLFRSNGADVLSADRASIEFGSDAAIETVQTFTDMFESGILTNEDSTSQYEAFAQGKTAIHVNTSALQGAFMMGAEAGGWQLGARTLPAFDDQAVVPTNSGSFLAMFATDPAKQAAAWELMQWMTSERAYEIISTQIGYLPLRSSMTEEGGPLHEWVAQNPLVKPNLEQLDALEPWVSYPGDSYAQVDQVLATAIEESIYYGADPTATMREAADRAQGLIE
ncbi:extracellular solute-binding protein [Microbacterium sp. 2216-1]|uniref:extracellular solute-binding protein n=1 Tax=Microbacterium sp. 2216-1 TaxID=3390053 RepID=UPI0039760C9C